MIRKIAVSIVLLIFIGSCAAPATGVSTQAAIMESPPPPTLPVMADIGDGGLLSGRPCAAPCVYGIRIGETPLDQVIPILEQNGLSHCQREESASWIGITCGFSVVVQVDGATSVVNGTGFYPTPPIALEEITEKYGEPDFVALRAEGPTEAPTSRITLLWDELNMIAAMPFIDGHTYTLEGTTTAEMVLFLDDTLYTDSSEIEFGGFYQQWNGYGAYRP